MNDTVKHWFDVGMLAATAAGVALNSVVAFLASVAALTWYTLRIYDWYKGKTNGNVQQH